jgi:hypothetical protein
VRLTIRSRAARSIVTSDETAATVVVGDDFRRLLRDGLARIPPGHHVTSVHLDRSHEPGVGGRPT